MSQVQCKDDRSALFCTTRHYTRIQISQSQPLVGLPWMHVATIKSGVNLGDCDHAPLRPPNCSRPRQNPRDTGKPARRTPPAHPSPRNPGMRRVPPTPVNLRPGLHLVPSNVRDWLSCWGGSDVPQILLGASGAQWCDLVQTSKEIRS